MVGRGIPLFTSKEDGNFREALKLYDQKQYKKALRLVEANLKKNSNHAESLALKGCINFYMGQSKDAEPYIIKALKKEPNNYLVDHLAGIYYRAVENYAEAGKWMKAASDNGSPNKQIFRDTAILQAQNRDFKNLVESRQAFLEHQPGYRANWTAVAIAHYLNKDYKASITTLSKIEEIIKDHLTDADRYEQSECVLFKNDIIYESGDVSGALETLNKDEGEIKDHLAILEYRANYLNLLGEKQKASLIYRQLLQRNPDIVDYYYKLEETLGTIDKPVELRLKLYEKLARFYKKSDPPVFLPLVFLSASHPKFEEKAEEYILGQLKRGVPSAFVNVKPLYKSKGKADVIEKIVIKFLKEQVPSLIPTVEVWTKYFLAQHYLYLKQLDIAMKYITEALTHSPTLVELYIIKARVLKHLGKLEDAAQVMEEGRQLDLQDRFINSKTAKYLLRANKVDEAVDIISLFTKLDENAVNGCKDLHLMQVNWFLVESAEAYIRSYKQLEQELANLSPDEPEFEQQESELLENIEIFRGLALKRYRSVVKIFDIFYNDQFDFHSYATRRGTPRHYITSLRWEDNLRVTPIYTRVLRGLADFYFDIGQQGNLRGSPDIESKHVKNNKKNKKAKAQILKKKADLIGRVESEKNDPDPLGAKLLSDLTSKSSNEIIDELYELFKPLNDSGKDLILTWEVLFKIHMANGKYVLALQAIKNLNKILDPSGEKKLKVIGEMIYNLLDTTRQNPDVNAIVVKAVEMGTQTSYPELSELSKEDFLKLYHQ